MNSGNIHTQQLVFVRLALALIIGIFVGQLFSFSFPLPFGLPILFLSFLLCVVAVGIRFPIAKKWLVGCIIYFALTLIGFCLVGIQNHRLSFERVEESKLHLALQIQSTATEKPNSVEYKAKIVAAEQEELINEQIIVYASKEIANRFPTGTVLYANQYFQRIAAPKNPHQFNYQSFMDKKGIHYQLYLPQPNLLAVDEPKTQTKSLIQRLQAFCFQFIENHIESANKGVAKALLLGYKNELSDLNAEQFRRSGTMHILAVSGLHVGIIYLLLQSLLSIFPTRKSWVKLFQLAIIIAGVWLFALLTGAKASVLRAACMFSFFAIGRFAFPTWNSINVLAAVAVLLLMYKPNYLQDVGFQMSFSAVLGILLAHPYMKLFYTKYQLLNYFIDIIYISLVAQLATLPFVLLYFHQFPVLGLFANCLAIPLTFAIVFTGFTGFIVSVIPVLSDGLGWLLNGLISTLNRSNSLFSSLDFAVIPSIYINTLQAFFIGLTILLFMLCIRIKSKKLFIAGIYCALVVVTSSSAGKLKAIHQAETIVYSTKEGLVIDLLNGRKSTIFSTLSIDSTLLNYTIRPNHLANYIQQKQVIQLSEKNVEGSNFYWQQPHLFVGKQLLQIGENSTSTSNTNLLVLPSAKQIPKELPPRQQILIYNEYRPYWLLKTGQIHFLREDGYYTINDSKIAATESKMISPSN